MPLGKKCSNNTYVGLLLIRYLLLCNKFMFWENLSSFVYLPLNIVGIKQHNNKKVNKSTKRDHSKNKCYYEIANDFWSSELEIQN